MKHFLATILITLFISVQLQAQDVVYEVDNEKSSITFTVKHMGFLSVDGTIAEFSGKIQTDQDGVPTTALASIAVNSIDTNNTQRDKSVKSEDFLNVEQFPEITFNGTDYSKDESGDFQVTGDLTIRGNTKRITFPFEFNDEGRSVRISGEVVVDRDEFDLQFSSALNGLVGDEITVKFEIVAEQSL